MPGLGTIVNAAAIILGNSRGCLSGDYHRAVKASGVDNDPCCAEQSVAGGFGADFLRGRKSRVGKECTRCRFTSVACFCGDMRVFSVVLNMTGDLC